MDELDPEMQKRVWQRVQRRETAEMPPLGRDNLRPWLELSQRLSAAYQSLGHQLSGREGEILRQLHQQSQRSAACLRGICSLRREQVQPLSQEKRPKEPPRRTLEACYRWERQLWEGLQQMADDGEYGVVFAALARQAQERCCLVAELLGRKW